MKHLIKGENLQYLFREKNNNGAEFTAKSRTTNTEYTFSVSRSKYKGVWYTHVYVEMEYQNFKRLGTYFNGRIMDKRVEVTTPAAKAIRYILKRVQLEQYADLDANIEIMHCGSCLVCGKTLTDSDSIEHGIGPVCRTIPKNTQLRMRV